MSANTAIKKWQEASESDPTWKLPPMFYAQQEIDALRAALAAAQPAAQVGDGELPQALDDALADTDQVPYLIVFDDVDQLAELVIGGTRARYRFKQISTSWNAHLYAKIASNSRDERFPNAAPSPAAVQPERLQNWIDMIHDNERSMGDRLQSLSSIFGGLLRGDAMEKYPLAVIREQQPDSGRDAALLQNAELVHERLKDIRYLGPRTHASDLAGEALPCIRAIIAAQQGE